MLQQQQQRVLEKESYFGVLGIGLQQCLLMNAGLISIGFFGFSSCSTCSPAQLYRV